MKTRNTTKAVTTAIAVLVAATIAWGAASAQGTPNSGVTQEMRAEANKLFLAQDWEKAAQAYEKIIGLEPQNANALYRLGAVYHSMKKYDRAAQAYERSAAITPNGFTWYNLACSLALIPNRGKALDALEKAVAGGFANVQQIQTDTDLAGLRDDPKFKAAVEAADRTARPCEFSAKHREFDFWIGDWNVDTQQGQRAGTNLVLKLEDGCIIQENWAGTLGGTGKSINFYDRTTGKWRQTWVSNSGGVAEFVGEYKDGAMRFEGSVLTPNGTKMLRRLTFFNLEPGRVRQFAEQSTDEGKTWTVTYDFIYTRKKA